MVSHVCTVFIFQQMSVQMVLQWFPVLMIPVVSVLTTPVLDVRPTTVAGALQSTMMRGATMSLDYVALLPRVRIYACTCTCMA